MAAAQVAMPTPHPGDEESNIWVIENMELSGLGSKIYSNEEKTQVSHFVRQAGVRLWQDLQTILSETKKLSILNLKGDPGAGKSTAVFGWVCHQATIHNHKVCFVTQTDTLQLHMSQIVDGNIRKLDLPRGDYDPMAEIAGTGSRIFVLDNFKAIGGEPDKGPGSASYALNRLIAAFPKGHENTTVILCSSLQADSPSVKSLASADYVLRNHFMCGWSDFEMAECRRLATGRHVLQDELTGPDKGPFLEQLRFAGGNMRLMNTDLTETKQFLDDKIARMRVTDILDGVLQYGHPDIVNTLFVHTSQTDMRLVSEYVEQVVTTKVNITQVHVARLLDPSNNSYQGWLLEILMKIVFQNSLKKNTKVVFDKRPAGLKMLPPQVSFTVSRIVTFGSLYADLSDWVVQPNERVVFLPTKHNQPLFDSVLVHCNAAGKYHVYFFQATVSKTHTMLFGHGGIFLAYLFPDLLKEGGSIADRVKTMRESTEKIEKLLDVAEIQRARKAVRRYSTEGEATTAPKKRVVQKASDKDPLLAEEQVLKMSGDDAAPRASLQSTASTDMDVSYTAQTPALRFDALGPVDTVPVHLRNKPTSLELHYYIVADAKNFQEFNVKGCAVYDIEYVQQFDKNFSQSKVRVCRMSV